MIDTTSADLKTAGINAKYVDVNSVSGEVTLTECETTDAKIKTVSGDVKFIGKAENVNYKTVSGNAEIRSECAVKELTGKTVSGNSIIAIPEDCDFAMNFSSTSGDFNSDFGVVTNGDVHTKGSGEYKYNVSSVSGDLYVSSSAAVPSRHGLNALLP